jgi:hypothetical protein
MTKAEQIRERIDQLVEGGLSKADAFRALAGELGQTPKSLQGAYYSATRKANGGSTPRKRETTPADAVDAAKAVLTKAIESIDAEIMAAKDRADEAKREHEAMKASATARKAAITAKLDALSS